jgi:hypothetical protein
MRTRQIARSQGGARAIGAALNALRRQGRARPAQRGLGLIALRCLALRASGEREGRG